MTTREGPQAGPPQTEHRSRAALGIAAGLGLVLLASYLFGGLAGLLVAVVVACAAALVALRLSLPRHPLPRRPLREVAPQPNADFLRYRRLQDELGWARVSRRHFDGPPRRLLTRLVTDLVAERRGVDLARHPEAGRELLGPALWPLVDPERPASIDSDAPGVDLATLDRVIARLEEL